MSNALDSGIYRQHDAAFSRVSAYVITDSAGELVARVALKFPADGAGHLYCYFHLIGSPMVRAFAGGYGYDKRSAAVGAALRAMRPEAPSTEPWADRPDHRELERLAAEKIARFRAMGDAREIDSGEWQRVFEAAGFRVLQAV